MGTLLALPEIIEGMREMRGAIQLGWRERREAVVRWARGWQEPKARDVEELVEASRLSPPMVRWGVRTTCGVLTPEAIDRFVGDALGFEPEELDAGTAVGLPVVGHVWASTLPTSGWLPVIGSLLLGSSVLIKTSSRTGGLAGSFIRSLNEAEARLMGRVGSTSWGRSYSSEQVLVDGVDGLVVSGGAEAVAAYGRCVADRAGGWIPYVPFGPGQSLLVVPAEAMASEAPDRLAAAIALDVAAYDQQGCLSPRSLWIEADVAEGRALAMRVAEALGRLASALPRGEVPDGAAAAIMQRVGAAHFLGEVFEALDGVVLFEPAPNEEPNPLYRTLPVHLYAGGPEGLARSLGSGAERRLHAVGVAGGEAVRRRYRRFASERGASRVCSPGTMQTPPLSWHHDGMNWLAGLVRYTDIS